MQSLPPATPALRWYWDGETGGTDPTFDDQINRFVAGKTFEIRRIA